MKYAGFMTNDFTDGGGVCVSLWTQGCPIHCDQCHNPQLQDFEGGTQVPSDLKGQIIKAICDNGIERNFSVLGGEPLCEENVEFVDNIITAVRMAYPNIKIYVWTGYTKEWLDKLDNEHIKSIFSQIDYLIDGPYVKQQRDITLPLRGSANQRIIDMKENI